MEFLMQPISRTLLEEINDNNSMMENVRVLVVAAAEVELAAPAASSADRQICLEAASAKPAGADGAECLEHSIEQLDPKTPGWAQRVRVSAAALGRAPFPDRVTALEKTV
ncbi:hypothetical protein CFC21_057045 [Triticum aestivum]|uniref:Uncharacterized protein n=3 Tax=Triticum TaxID=4564 RepID=A0A9R0WAN6_TRITD|nr:uncharacterized protein LOC123091424 [Triticum aestivum]KAF7048256.1 hypothetical protein CFC21_057045 [Triticum aestivum]VAI03512.1 unnamed protein product [Triticum turgidum subsp. durum]